MLQLRPPVGPRTGDVGSPVRGGWGAHYSDRPDSTQGRLQDAHTTPPVRSCHVHLPGVRPCRSLMRTPGATARSAGGEVWSCPVCAPAAPVPGASPGRRQPSATPEPPRFCPRAIPVTALMGHHRMVRGKPDTSCPQESRGGTECAVGCARPTGGNWWWSVWGILAADRSSCCTGCPAAGSDRRRGAWCCTSARHS